MAPELFGPNLNTIGIKIDIFALGVILFIMKVLKPPFQAANEGQYLKLQMLPDKYWEELNKIYGPNVFSEDLMDLITLMLK